MEQPVQLTGFYRQDPDLVEALGRNAFSTDLLGKRLEPTVKQDAMAAYRPVPANRMASHAVEAGLTQAGPRRTASQG